jgi:hypothetical protein
MARDALRILSHIPRCCAVPLVQLLLSDSGNLLQTRIQAQAMQAQASTSGPASQTSSQAVVNYCSTLYE